MAPDGEHNLTEPSKDVPPEIVARARTGDREALEELVRCAHPLVHRWALVRTGDPAEADDLTQDVLVQVIRRIGSFEGSAKFTTWLYTVTRNAAADRFRGRGRRAELHAEVEAHGLLDRRTDPPDAEGAVDRERLSSVVLAFFRELPERQRQVFDLAELQGLAAREVGERLGIDPVTVRVSLMKARRTLRRRILDAHPELVEDLT